MSPRTIEQFIGDFAMHISPLVGLQTAAARLAEAPEPKKVLYFVSDFRDRDWSAAEGEKLARVIEHAHGRAAGHLIAVEDLPATICGSLGGAYAPYSPASFNARFPPREYPATAMVRSPSTRVSSSITCAASAVRPEWNSPAESFSVSPQFR